MEKQRRFKHKLTGKTMILLKERKNTCSMLIEDEPTRIFYGRNIPNKQICRKINLEEILEDGK